jgi:hypothetical protein
VVLSEAEPILDTIGPHPNVHEPNKWPVQADLLSAIISIYAYPLCQHD